MQLVAEDEKNDAQIMMRGQVSYVPQCSSSRRTRRTHRAGHRKQHPIRAAMQLVAEDEKNVPVDRVYELV